MLIMEDPAPIRASLIVVAHNNRLEIGACLRSARASLGPTDELIVVDNASSDGTPDLIAALFPDLILLRSPVNLGFGGGNNLAASFARGRYLAFLNPDTLVDPNWLTALLHALETVPHAGLATSKILLLHDPHHINTCGNAVHLTGLTLCRGLGQPRRAYSALEEVPAVSGAAFAIPRRLFEMLAGFDRSFFMYLEDTDLSLRARLAGYKCLYVPASLVYHAYRLRFPPHKTFYLERNRYRMLRKVFHPRTLLALLPALLLAEVVAWGFVILHQPRSWADKLRAYGSIMDDWPYLKQAYRRTQDLRRLSDRDLLASAGYSLNYEQACHGLAPRLAHWLFDPLFRNLARLVSVK